MSKRTQPTTPPRERAFLVGVEFKGQKALLALEDSLTELALLADTAGLEVVGELTQKLGGTQSPGRGDAGAGGDLRR
jgi:GTP-binding protein HflX